LILVAAAGGCTSSDQDFGIRLEQLEAKQTPTGVSVRARQEIRLSAEARRALQHGVPLRIRIDLSLNGGFGLAGGDKDSFIYEIRYLPLSDHYQLTRPGSEDPAKTFPRLRHVLATLGNIDLNISGIQAGTNGTRVRLRSRLDHSGMPGPMQLPVYLSPEWKHDSGWVAAEVAAQAAVGG